VLLAAARIDAPFPRAARTLYTAAASDRKRLLIVAEPGHGTDLLLGRFDRPALREVVSRFVRASEQ
jgi:hypothetical protein